MLNATRIDKRIARREAAQFRARRNATTFALELRDGLELPARESIHGPMRVDYSFSTGTWEVR